MKNQVDNQIKIESYDWISKNDIMIIGKHNVILIDITTGLVKVLTIKELKARLKHKNKEK